MFTREENMFVRRNISTQKISEKLTTKQWNNLSSMLPPAASKVAISGAINPYPMPPKRLTIIPRTGQSTRGNGNATNSKIFCTNPSLLVLNYKPLKRKKKWPEHKWKKQKLPHESIVGEIFIKTGKRKAYLATQ